jgi:hypothetical protein
MVVRGDSSPLPTSASGPSGLCFELVAVSGTARSALTGTVGHGRSRFKAAAGGLKPLAATAHNATALDCGSAHRQPHRSAPPRDRETCMGSPVGDFLVTSGRSQGKGSSPRSGPSPARQWPTSRVSRIGPASADRAQAPSAPSRSTPETACAAFSQHDLRSSEPPASRVIDLTVLHSRAGLTGSCLHVNFGTAPGRRHRFRRTR